MDIIIIIAIYCAWNDLSEKLYLLKDGINKLESAEKQ